MSTSRMAVAAGVFVVASLSLGVGFRFNGWGLADQRQFERQNADMEAHVVARLVKSRQDGLFSSGGLLGLGTEDGRAVDWWNVPREEQFDAYRRDVPFRNYEPYESQPGAQGILFSILDRIVDAPPSRRLDLYRTLTSVASAIVLGLVVTWFHLELGGIVAAFVLVSALVSEWLTAFGGKMFWSLWAFYVPMLAVMYGLRGKRRLERGFLHRLGGLVFFCLFVKILFTGFEYITTTLIMTSVPIAFYGTRYRWSIAEWRRVALATGVGCFLAVGAGLAVLLVQIAEAEGAVAAGVDHVIHVLRERTYADPGAFGPGLGLQASPEEVVVMYLKGVWFDLNRYLTAPTGWIGWYVLRIRYAYLIAGFAAASAALFLQGRRSESDHRETDALLTATWFSLLAPLSWFLIFKSHSFVHVGMNNIAWHMPFVLFGFAVVGDAFGQAAVRLRGGVRRSA